MKAYKGSRDIALLILNLGTVAELTLRPFYPRGRTPADFESEAGPHSRSGCFGEKSLAPT